MIITYINILLHTYNYESKGDNALGAATMFYILTRFGQSNSFHYKFEEEQEFMTLKSIRFNKSNFHLSYVFLNLCPNWATNLFYVRERCSNTHHLHPTDHTRNNALVDYGAQIPFLVSRSGSVEPLDWKFRLPPFHELGIR